MSNYIKNIKNSLENIISELSENPSLFLKNPESDFTRNRKINFKTLVGITMNSGGCTMNKELLDYFGFNLNTPTVSAYTQQRSKVLPLAFRIVRFKLSDNSYETIITNLDRFSFSSHKLKELYHLRWGIETSFRELKYAIGLTSFHAKKVEYIKQEIFARLTLYNYCELITTHVMKNSKKI